MPGWFLPGIRPTANPNIEMKKSGLLVCATVLLTLAAGPAALAKGKTPPKKPSGPPSAVFAKYDADHNGVLNVEEAEAVRSAFSKNPTDPLLKAIDTNQDGALSDAEMMAIRPTQGAAAPKKKAPATPKKNNNPNKPTDKPTDPVKDEAAK
jgi:hypothetical protein